MFRRSSGFTVLRLLLVITLLSILAAAAVPGVRAPQAPGGPAGATTGGTAGATAGEPAPCVPVAGGAEQGAARCVAPTIASTAPRVERPAPVR